MNDEWKKIMTGETLLLATRNTGKIKQFQALLAPFPIKVASYETVFFSEVEETGSSFAENATLKARAVAQETGLPALADDSGLCVSALDGAPGIFSARWGGAARDYQEAMTRLHKELMEKKANTLSEREAYFVTVLALAYPDDAAVRLFTGKLDGHIIWPPRGTLGFGYDPVFQPAGQTRSLAEIPPFERYGTIDAPGLSHRARAFSQFVRDCL